MKKQQEINLIFENSDLKQLEFNEYIMFIFFFYFKPTSVINTLKHA